MKQQLTPPVNEGEEWNIDVEGYGKNNDPFGKVQNFVIFINDTKGRQLAQGTKHKVKITKVLRRVALAEWIEEIA